jgi:hypothetical protein
MRKVLVLSLRLYIHLSPCTENLFTPQTDGIISILISENILTYSSAYTSMAFSLNPGVSLKLVQLNQVALFLLKAL